MSEYTYQCKDYSLLSPLFKSFLVIPLIRFVPRAIPANLITIVSSVFFYLALYLSFNKQQYVEFILFVIPFLLLANLIGSHLGRAQALRTKTGSTLGEFCNHYLNAFNNGFLIIILCNLFEVNNVLLMILVVISSYWALVMLFYEQFKTGWMIVEKFGSLEAVILAIVLILFAEFETIHSFYYSTLIPNLRAVDLLLIAVCFGAIFTFIKTLWRTPNVRYSIWLFMGSSIVIAILGTSIFSNSQLAVILILYSSLYLGKVMIGHLIDGIERSPGLFTPLFLLIITGTGLYEGNSFVVLLVYLSASIILLIFRTFQSIGKHWLWVNPPLDFEKIEDK